MTNTGNLKLATRGDREIVMTRTFDAPRNLVFDAFTKPELVDHVSDRARTGEQQFDDLQAVGLG